MTGSKLDATQQPLAGLEYGCDGTQEIARDLPYQVGTWSEGMPHVAFLRLELCPVRYVTKSGGGADEASTGQISWAPRFNTTESRPQLAGDIVIMTV